MKRRTFGRVALGAASFSAARNLFGQSRQKPPRFNADWESIRTHQVPEWYRNAKLGIFIHWGLYSVPAWAPPTGELGKVDWNKWFANNPYAEWYLNTLRIPDSPTRKHHIQTWGENYDYYNFANLFNKETAKWDPASWAKLFRDTGARYVVLTTKHHDGFRLWPSSVQNPVRPKQTLSAARDLVGDLTTAVRATGLRMGLYYSGGLDWTFTPEPIRTRDDLRRLAPQTEEYARYADAHWRELTDKYKPAVMWNDITYPKAGHLPEIFAHYYNTVPEGVIDDRFGVDFSDFTTPEYAKYDKVTEKKWESCRGLGFSFGYNQAEGPEHVIAADKLIALFVDIVSKNGNLLLNIGPRPDGTISDIQTDRLRELARWLSVNGEGIFDTSPWVRASASDPNAPDVRFTRKANNVYAFILDGPAAGPLMIPGVLANENTKVRLLGTSTDARWKQNGRNLEVERPSGMASQYAVGVRISPEPVA